MRVKRDMKMIRRESRIKDEGYPSWQDPKPSGPSGPIVHDNDFVGMSIISSTEKMEAIKLIRPDSYLSGLQLSQFQQTRVYDSVPFPAPPPIPTIGRLNSRERIKLPEQPRTSHENDSTTTKPKPVYPEILNKEITQPPDVRSLESFERHSDSEVAFTSNTQLSLDHSTGAIETRISDDAVSKSSHTISKETICSALLRCMGTEIETSCLENSASEAAITPVNGEPRSQTIKRSSQEWWLAHASEPRENILPEQDMVTFVDRRLLHLIFSCWYQDLMAIQRGLCKSRDWMFSLGATFNQEARVVEQLIHDVFLHLARVSSGSTKRTPVGSSTSNALSETATTPHHGFYRASKMTGKRRDIHEEEPGGDGLDGDNPNQNDRTKRIKKTTNEYNRYVICPQFAAGQEPARSNCFFGEWCSVDRLKRDHLISVHNFDTSQMKVDRGGTESEKWWRLFDKLNPGFREANPEVFIPGPFWEDRVAHNTYNKIFSEAMKKAERIQQRRT
jgi:hypothetical protein